MAAPRFKEKALIYRSVAGLSQVWKAWDTQRNCLVAVKEVVCESNSRAESRLSEAHMQMSLFHPALCRIWDAYIEDNTAVLVLEWMDCDLEAELRRRRRERREAAYPDAEAMAIRLIDALAYAQSAGLCHRDIKPGNLFLSSAGEIKLGDFGSALVSEPMLTAYSITGTPMFLSPKLRFSYARFLEGQEDGRASHDPYKSDVYSLGLTLLYCFIEEISRVIRLKTDEDVRTEIAKIQTSQWLQEVIGTMLVLEETQRPSFIELRRRLLIANPMIYLPFTNEILQLSGSVWMPLVDFHVIEALQGPELKAETVIKTHCKACGAVIELVGQRARMEGLQAEYCSQACQLQATGSSFTAAPVRKRIVRIIKKEKKLQSGPCIYCLQDKMDSEAIPLCAKHTLCSVECMQGLSNAITWSEVCPICQPEETNNAKLQSDIGRLEQEAEEQFCLESFGTAAEESVSLSDRMKTNYSMLLRSLFGGFKSLGALEIMAREPALGQLYFSVTCKLLSSNAKPCTPGKHGISDKIMYECAYYGSNFFSLPIQPMVCTICQKQLTIREMAAGCNRYIQKLSPKLCPRCRQFNFCSLTECCGVLSCFSCQSTHQCAK